MSHLRASIELTAAFLFCWASQWPITRDSMFRALLLFVAMMLVADVSREL